MIKVRLMELTDAAWSRGFAGPLAWGIMDTLLLGGVVIDGEEYEFALEDEFTVATRAEVQELLGNDVPEPKGGAGLVFAESLGWCIVIDNEYRKALTP